MGDTKAREAFHYDAYDDAEHGGTAVKQFSSLELRHEGQLFGAVVEQLFVGGSVGRGDVLSGIKRSGSALASIGDIRLQQ